MAWVVYVNYFDLNVVFFIYNEKVFTIERDTWILFLSQYELTNVEIIIVVDDKLTRKNLIFIYIRNKSLSSYLKAITETNFMCFLH